MIKNTSFIFPVLWLNEVSRNILEVVFAMFKQCVRLFLHSVFERSN